MSDSVGDWLWSEFMDLCKRRGVHPADNNDLFALVSKARAKFPDVEARK